MKKDKKFDILIKILLFIATALMIIIMFPVSAEEYTANRLTHYGYNCKDIKLLEILKGENND